MPPRVTHHQTTDGPPFATVEGPFFGVERAASLGGLDDSLWLGRAHSLGHARQHVELLGYALMVNGIALHRHAKRRQPLAA